jgi:hypothetical protein
MASSSKPLPSKVLIVRHGEREDHINHSWKTTAMRPHDSPLSARGVVQATKLGIHAFPRLLEHAYSRCVADTVAMERDPAFAKVFALSRSVEGYDELPMVAYTLAQVLFWSSPLTRCVQTSHNIADGLVRAAVNHITGEHATAEDKARVAAVMPVPVIFIEDSLVEEDKWMGFDMRSAPMVAKHGVPNPLLFDAAHHAKNTSSYVDVTGSARPSRLIGVDFHAAADGKIIEFLSTIGGASNKAPVKQRSIDERVQEAVNKFLAGAGHHGAMSDSTTLFLVSHGKTSTTWYNQLLRAAAAKARAAGTADTAGNRTAEIFSGNVAYTAFAEYTWLPSHGRYTPSSAPFQTPHLPVEE